MNQSKDCGGPMAIECGDDRRVEVRTHQQTFWNYEPTPCRKVRVRVGTVPVPTWWCAGMEGTVREAVEVTYGGGVFFLDNENGSGWGKVTGGRGGPEWGHSSLPDDSVVEDEQ